MKTVILDSDRIESFDDIHAAFASALDFPDYYGANLDALHDMLTERTDPTGVIVIGEKALKEKLGTRFSVLLRLLNATAKERKGLYIAVDPFGKI